MALTTFQRSICHLLAPIRLERESYVAGGVALNAFLDAPRLSRDIDLFHDTTEALASTVQQDKALLESNGFSFEFVRDAVAYAEAVVSKSGGSTLVQWVRDSAFRFFPLLEDAVFGLVLHPFDLATNKILAMAGRLEPRDWIDVINCCEKLQPLGYLVWAACGKDPGFGPLSLLQEMQRSTRYSQAELNVLDFDGKVPDAAELGARWHELVGEAKGVINQLPPDHVGKCVLTSAGKLCGLPRAEFRGFADLKFHEGQIGGALPTFPDA